MHYLTYVVGADPDEVLRRWKGIKWDSYVVGGRWGHLRRRPKDRLPLPYHIARADGTWISQADASWVEMAETLRAIDPSERITIVELHR